MKRPVKYAVWIAGAVIVLLIATAATLYVLYPKDKIIAAVIPKAEKALQRPVTLEDAGISLWPPFGVYLNGLRVKNLPQFQDEYLLSADEARASIKLWPLVAGKLVFGELSLRGIAINYEVADSVTSNVSDILAGEGSAPEMLVQKFRLEDARIHYVNRPDEQSLLLTGMAADFDVDPGAGAFEAHVSLPHWSWTDAGEETSGDDAVELAIRGAYDGAAKRLQFGSVTGEVSSVPISGKAQVALDQEPATMEAQFDLGPAKLASILEQLPPSRREALGTYEISGDLSGKLVWSGAVGGDGPLPISGELTWLRGRIADGGVELAHFEGLSVPFDASGFHVTTQSLQVLGGDLQLGVLATGMPPEKYEITMSGQLDLERVGSYREIPGMTGKADYSLSASGPADKLERWDVKLHLEPKQAQFAQAGRVPVVIPNGSLDYDGGRLQIRNLRAQSGRSRLALSGSVTGIELSTLTADSMTTIPQAELAISSTCLDLDEFFPDLAADTAQPAVQSSTPPPVAVKVGADLSADTLIVGGAEWHRVRGRIEFADGKLTIDTLRGQVYGGAALVAGTIDLTNPDDPEYHVSARADSVRIDGALARFTGLSRHLRGQSNLSARVDGRGTEWRDVVNQLTVDGTALLFDAGLVDLAPSSSVMGLLGLKPQEDVPLRTLKNAFRIEQGRVTLDDFRFMALESDWSLSGSAGLDGTLDYSLAAVLSKGLSDQVQLPEGATSGLRADWLQKANPVDLLKNDKGQMEVAFSLQGPYDKPKVGLDWDRMLPLMKSRFEARTTDKLKEQVEEKAKEGLKGLLDKFKR